MVKITGYKTYQKEDGTEFHALIVQGGLEAVKSQETQRTYFTTRTTKVPCTFNELMCKSLVGTDLPGVIKRVETEPYVYVAPETGEIMTLSHRFEYDSDEQSNPNEIVIKEELAI